MNTKNGSIPTRNDIITQSVQKTDGWSNIYTREGTQGVAKSTGFNYIRDLRITESIARQIYRSDGFGSKIVDRPVSDMTREWFDVIGDSDGIINSFLRKIQAKKHTKAALTWADVFGGSIMVMGIDDGGELDEPLNEKKMRVIEFLKVYDRYRATWTSEDVYDDPEEPKFGMPQWYQITPIESNVNPFKVHETRVLRFDGPLTDDKTFKENNRWNESLYRKIETQLININSAFAASKDVMDDFIQTILKIENLQQMIASGQDDLVKKRLNILDLGRHVMNTMMLDANEDYTKEASSVSGMDKLLQEFQQALSAVTDIPMTILMGRSPGGQNATGDADIRLYYDKIADDQDDRLFDQMTRLVEIVQKTKEGPTKGVFNEDWFIEFNPLWQPTEKEIVETRKMQAETDNSYITHGVLLPEEVAISRFGGDEYSIETEINEAFERVAPNFGGSNEPDEDEEEDEEKKTIIKSDGYKPSRKLRRKKDTKSRFKPRVDLFDEGNIAEGITGEENEHTHEFVIWDKESGNGWTSSNGKDNHVHRVEGFTVQPHEGKDGTTHMHTLPEINTEDK